MTQPQPDAAMIRAREIAESVTHEATCPIICRNAIPPEEDYCDCDLDVRIALAALQTCKDGLQLPSAHPAQPGMDEEACPSPYEKQVRDALFDMVADAVKAEDEFDGDCESTTHHVRLLVHGSHFADLAELAGVETRYGETALDAINREIWAEQPAAPRTSEGGE